jgi:hypothetical protein
MDNSKHFKACEIAEIIESHVRRHTPHGERHHYETEWGAWNALVVRITPNAQIFDYSSRDLESLAAHKVNDTLPDGIHNMEFKWSKDENDEPRLRVVVTPVQTAVEESDGGELSRRKEELRKALEAARLRAKSRRAGHSTT